MFTRRVFLFSVALFVLSGCATTSTMEARKRIRFTQVGNDVMVSVDNEILFDLGEATLRKEAAPVLDTLVSDSLSKTKKDFRIEGHTDSRGIAENNQKLSERRADAVKVALVNRGIVSSRITTKGWGSTRPAVPNATSDADHQSNRRAVILIANEKVENIRSTKLEDGIASIANMLGLK